MVTKINTFTLILENLVSSLGKNSPSPTRKPNGQAVPNKKMKPSDYSSIPTLPPTEF